VADYSYEIGANAGARQNVETLGVNPPRGQLNEYSVRRTGGDGVEVGDGFPAAVWEFDFLTVAMFNILCGYITGASTVVSIKTRKSDGTYQAYATAVMHRPQIPNDAVRVFGGWQNVVFRFTRLEV